MPDAEDFFAFDDAYTAAMNGYADAITYYTQASCGQFLKGVRRPTLVINAEDDPFMVPAVIPRATELAPAVTLELAQHGGHLGFIAAGAGGRPAYWLEQRVPEFLFEAHAAARSGETA